MNYYLEPSAEGVDVVVTGRWTESAGAPLLDGRATGLVLNYAKGFEGDLPCLAGLPIRRLDILARWISDISPIYTTVGPLDSLLIDVSAGTSIELDRLPSLRTLGASWRQIYASVRYLTQIETLRVLGYAEEDLSALSSLSSLRDLALLDRPRARTLDGVEYLPWLSRLGVFGSPLTDIRALARASSPVLETLEISHTRRFANIDAIRNCTGLRKLTMAELGDLDSLSPIEGLTEIERLDFHGSTRIMDGDLSAVLRLPRLKDFRMQSRASYRPSVPHIEAALKERASPRKRDD